MRTSFYVAINAMAWLGLLEKERTELLALLKEGFVTYRDWNDLTVVIETVEDTANVAVARKNFTEFCTGARAKCGDGMVLKTYERTGAYEFDTR